MARRPLPDLLNGPVTPTLVNLSLPLAGAMLLNSAIGIIDLIYVGRLGKEALAAVALCFPLHLLIITAGAGMSDAVSAVLARYFGAGDKEHTERIALYAAFAWLGLTALMMPLGLIFSPLLPEAPGAGPARRGGGPDYGTPLYR